MFVLGGGVFLQYCITIFYLFVTLAFINCFWNGHIYMVESLRGPADIVDELNAFQLSQNSFFT